VQQLLETWRWRYRRGSFDLSRTGVIMGILNVTPDSFSDGNHYPSDADATAAALTMVEEGAEIIDIGGESTRPGSDPVATEEEMVRVLPVIKMLREKSDVVISIDTMKADVAEAAIEAGADIINDVSGLTADERMVSVARETGAGVVIMHMKGRPKTMQLNPHYEDVVAEVADFFRQQITLAVDSGINHDCIVLDPGIGFGKSLDHNIALLRSLSSFPPRPLLIGVSRKSLLSKIGGGESVDSRFWPGVALTSLCREFGARIFRVHDVAPHLQALMVSEAVLGTRSPLEE